jgi:type III pantothenate kinase
MNILAIDAGNTRVKWGIADENGWLRHGWIATMEAANIGAALGGLPRSQRIVISNVAGENVCNAITRSVAPYGVEPHWITAQAHQCGVRSSYADPAQLGSDRWAALIAAWKIFGRACVVVNAGTTMTVDALSAEGVFLGGCIVAGADLMRAALDRGTAQLKQRDGAFAYYPDNTADAIMSGAINALAGTVERMAGYMTQTGQRSENCSENNLPLVVLSGGAADTLKPRLNVKVEQVDNLVLEGLLHIARGDG